MGTGKTHTGNFLARRLGSAFVDTDSMIEREAGISISEIFEKFGESTFRKLERDVIVRVSEMEGAVVAVGGGAVVNPENLIDLRRHGLLVCLTASPEIILSRTERNTDRPLLKVEDKIGKIRELLDKRAPFYGQADFKVDTDGKSPEQVAEVILELVQATGNKDSNASN